MLINIGFVGNRVLDDGYIAALEINEIIWSGSAREAKPKLRNAATKGVGDGVKYWSRSFIEFGNYRKMDNYGFS